ncbi:MAG: aromatic amino acid lyase, partial [Saprospiraceae bacterium]|nr:aromatic amino acid lyase [Saprospiraceae bacterium]
YTAASLVSENKQLSTPASVDSIVSSNGQEDHVSMGANAARKLLRVVDNVEKILAIEWLTALQAIEFRRPQRTNPAIESRIAAFREQVPYQAEDHILARDIQEAVQFIQHTKISNHDYLEDL